MLLDEAKKDLDTQGPGPAIARLAGHTDIAAAIDAYQELLLHAYWQRKDIGAVLAIGQAGLALMLATAARREGADATKALRSAKTISYNLASFCWPGWDEPGIHIGPPEQRAGQTAAQRHLTLAQELKMDDLRISRALWIVAAHQLTALEFVQARQTFEEAAKRAHTAGQEPDELLAKGFALLSLILGGPASGAEPEKAAQELAGIKSRFKEIKDDDDYINQLASAEKVCLQMLRR